MGLNSFTYRHDGQSGLMVFAHRNLFEQREGGAAVLSSPLSVTANAGEIRIEWGDPIDERFGEQGNYIVLGEFFDDHAPRFRTLCGLEPIWAMENLHDWFLTEVIDPMLQANYVLAMDRWIRRRSNLSGKKLLERAARTEYLDYYRGSGDVLGVLNDFLKSQGRRFETFVGGRSERQKLACYAIDAVAAVAKWRGERGYDGPLSAEPSEEGLGWRCLVAHRASIDRRDLDEDQLNTVVLRVHDPHNRDCFHLMREAALEGSLENCEVVWGEELLKSASVRSRFKYHCVLSDQSVYAFRGRSQHRFAQDVLPAAESGEERVALTATRRATN